MPNRDLCIMACAFCRDGNFQNWAAPQVASLELAIPGGMAPGRRERAAKALILHLAGVDSRNDLDRDPAAAQRFHELVRKPFLAWKENQQAAPVGR